MFPRIAVVLSFAALVGCSDPAAGPGKDPGDPDPADSGQVGFGVPDPSFEIRVGPVPLGGSARPRLFDEATGAEIFEPATWSSSDPQIVAVTGSGTLTGINLGEATIRAYIEPRGTAAEAGVRVAANLLLSLTATDLSGVGDTISAEVAAVDARGNPVALPSEPTLSVEPTGILDLLPGGLLVSRRMGEASVRAQFRGSTSNIVLVSVTQQLATIDLIFDPPFAAALGDTVVVTAEPRDTEGNLIEVNSMAFGMAGGNGGIFPHPDPRKALVVIFQDTLPVLGLVPQLSDSIIGLDTLYLMP